MPDGQQAAYKVAVQKPRVEQQGGGSSFNVAGGVYEFEREALDAIGAEIVEIDAETDEEFAALARDADAIISRGRRINADIIAALDHCVVIGCGSVGTDTVDVEAATAAGIVVTNVPDVFIEEVADHTMTMFLAAYRRLQEMRALMLEGRWSEGHPRLREIPRLWGQTMGLIAFGNVARAVARRCQPFGLHVIAHDPYVGELTLTAEHVEPVGYMEMLERADFVSLHCPGGAETRHLMNAARLARMKPGAILINTSRGDVIDEAALAEALAAGAIAGAGLDVYEDEPRVAPALLALENVVVLLPNLGSATEETRIAMGLRMLENARAFFAGEQPPDRVA